ncbi:MAG: hypothetical protein FWD98_02705 [Defluviitaleaceae bacterium]|nr:hypothetical protein [Defluviitaleaceae bacterium]
MSDKRTKIIVDIGMIILLVLSFIRWDGLGGALYHFAVGSLCAALFAVHIFLHWKWLRAATKSCLSRTLSKPLRGKYTVDVLLLAVWLVAIVTGFAAVAPFLGNAEAVSAAGRLHGVTSRIGLALIAVHIVQHIPQIKSYAKLR